MTDKIDEVEQLKIKLLRSKLETQFNDIVKVVQHLKNFFQLVRENKEIAKKIKVKSLIERFVDNYEEEDLKAALLIINMFGKIL